MDRHSIGWGCVKHFGEWRARSGVEIRLTHNVRVPQKIANGFGFAEGLNDNISAVHSYILFSHLADFVIRGDQIRVCTRSDVNLYWRPLGIYREAVITRI